MHERLAAIDAATIERLYAKIEKLEQKNLDLDIAVTNLIGHASGAKPEPRYAAYFIGAMNGACEAVGMNLRYRIDADGMPASFYPKEQPATSRIAA